MKQINDKRGQEPSNKPVEKPKEYAKIPPIPDYSKIGLLMCGNRMLIQQFPHVEQIGRILTPDNQQIQIDKGRIVACGPDVKLRKEGEVIFKAEGLGQTLKGMDGNSYIFLPENAAIAVDVNFVQPGSDEQ